MSETLRLQVFLSHQGVCSRRKAMELVQQGHVALNGLIVREPSTPVTPGKDQVSLDGKIVESRIYEYILLNKPAGYITTREDRFAEKTVLDLLPQELRHLNPVGRLDKDTEGLLLLTNDGDVALQLTHPRFEVFKTYEVVIAGQLTAPEQHSLTHGIMLEGRWTAPAKIRLLRQEKDKSEFLLTIHEGRKRQIRNMLAALKHRVIYLKRIEQGPLALGDLKTGGYRKLSAEEIERLKKFLEIKKGRGKREE